MRPKTLIAAISVLGLLLPALSFAQDGQQKSPPQQDQQLQGQQQQGQQQKGQQQQMDQAQPTGRWARLPVLSALR